MAVAATAAVQEIRSFAEPDRSARFLAFHEEILFGALALQDIATRVWLHNGVLEFHFEQLGDLGTSEDPADGRVVLLRVDGDLFAVRTAHPGADDGTVPILSLPTRDGQAELRVLSCDDFLKVWSEANGLAPDIYNTASSIQPFITSLVRQTPVQQHGRNLIVQSVLGQGLEGTVFGVQDAETGETLALKSTHKDVRDLYAHWKNGMERVRREAPHLLPHLCDFLSIECHGEQGCTVLLQYRPLTSFREFVGQLSIRERLREGLRILAGCIRLVQTLRTMEICHGDIGVSNLFVYPEAEGVEQVALIDPHPDGVAEPQATVRKDLFGLAHMLYWLVTGTEWPEGTHHYLQRVMAGKQNHEDATAVFRAPPLAKDRAYELLHEAAISALAGSIDTSDDICELILVMADRMSSSDVAASGHVVDGATVTAADIEHRFRALLRPIGSGLFLPLFSLPCRFTDSQRSQRDYGMGDCGPAAREFVRRLHETGQKYWCILPVGPTDGGNCVYRADSVFAMGLNTIPPDDLLEDGWVTAEEIDQLLPAVADAGRIPLDDPQILTWKRSLLQLAWERYTKQHRWHERFITFQRQEADWLYDYCLYKTIEAQYPGRWTNWPNELRDAEPAAIRTFAAEHVEDIQREAFFQFLAQHYFVKLRRYAESQGIVLIGDLPAYSAHGSADVWANRDVFELDPDGQRTIVAGAPPDMFDPHGQAWNHPMYRWDSRSTVKFHTKRFARIRRLYGRGFLRDDHIIGRITPWGFPFGSPPAEGSRVRGRFLGNPLFDALFARVPGLQQSLIGEDLGVVTEETTLLMQHYQLFGMRVLQFIPFHAGQAAVDADMYAPGNYSDRNLVLLGTHDTPTIREWWRDYLDETGRHEVGVYLRRATGQDIAVSDDNVARVMTEFAALQSAHMVLHQMPDLLAGPDGSTGLVNARMNDPSLGDEGGGWKANWSWRMTPEAFDQQTMNWLHTLTVAARRTPELAVQRLTPVPETAAEVLLACAVLRRRLTQGAELAGRLEEMAQAGRIRNAAPCRRLQSAVCGHVDGNVYLLLSSNLESGQTPVVEQAVSLIHAVDVAARHDTPYYHSPLEGCSSESLLALTTSETDHLEQLLQQLIAFSHQDQREQMVTRIGQLLSENAGTSDQPSQDHVTVRVPRRNAEAERYEATWTELWQLCERRGMLRSNVVEGLLRGTLYDARVSLRGLRWTLLTEFADETADAAAACRKLSASIRHWVATLSDSRTEAVLFGSLPSETAGDLHSPGPQGVSDALHRLRQARRKEQHHDTQELESRLPEYVVSLMETLSEHSSERQELLSHVEQFQQRGASAFEYLLEILEDELTGHLASLSSGRVAAEDADPAGIDTQIHSFHSDCGGQSIARIVWTARQRGLRTIAVTDHQTFEGVIDALTIGRRFGVEVIPAVELYTGIRRGGGSVQDRRDVLVYFPDVPRFTDWAERGFDAETWQLFDDGWDRHINGSQWGNVPVSRVTCWAREHGGVPVLAHPGLLSPEQFHREDWSYDAFERLFLETGLAGVEISHSKLPFEENTTRYAGLVREFNSRHPQTPLVFTVGTDAHTPDPLGRANLTANTVKFLTRELVSDGTLQQSIVDSLQQAARRIDEQSELYQLRSEVLERQFPGTEPLDRPLTVVRAEDDAPAETLIAGIKCFDGQPLIIVVNNGRRELSDGKDWGRIDISELLTQLQGHSADYEVQNLISGQSFRHGGTDLRDKGLAVGLLPESTQFLSISSSD